MLTKNAKIFSEKRKLEQDLQKIIQQNAVFLEYCMTIVIYERFL